MRMKNPSSSRTTWPVACSTLMASGATNMMVNFALFFTLVPIQLNNVACTHHDLNLLVLFRLLVHSLVCGTNADRLAR